MFDPLTAVVAGGLGLAGAVIGGSASKSAANTAADAQRDAAASAEATQMYMYDQTREDFEPFLETGTTAVPEIEGFQPGQQSTDMLNTMAQYEPLSSEKYQTPAFTGEFNFQGVDETDPIYKWKLKQLEDATNKAFAARGMYNSRPAVNALLQNTMALGAEETDKQYGRAVDQYGRDVQKYGLDVDATSRAYGRDVDEYNRLAGLYGQYSNLDTQEYSRLLDRVKIGQGAAGSTGQAAMQTAGNLSNVYGTQGTNLANIAMQQGTNQANLYTNMAAVPINAYSAYKMNQPVTPPPAAPAASGYSNLMAQQPSQNVSQYYNSPANSTFYQSPYQ